MPPPRGQQILMEDPTVCTKCELTFKTFMDYHQHKIRSRRHITCEVCSQDFESHEACKQHHDLMHAHEQDINCPGCGKHFTRLGGLMSHIELTECKYFKKETLERSRKMKEEWYSNAQNAHNHVAYGRTAGDFGEHSGPNPFSKPQPHKLVRGPDGVMLVDANGNPVKEPEGPKPLSPTSAVVFHDNDILSFDELGDAHGQPWGQLATAPPAHLVVHPAPVPLLKQEDFPALIPEIVSRPPAHLLQGLGQGHSLAQIVNPTIAANAPVAIAKPNIATDAPATIAKSTIVVDAPAIETKVGNAWDNKQKLFANAPAAITPPVELLQSMTVKDEEEDSMNPDSRSFRADKYFIKLTEKFRCPHRGCGKSIKDRKAFVDHLKSPAHRNEKLQCINCLRYFATATALTQHCEAQGVRCKVRQTSEYDGVVDGITGGTAVTAGRHVDDTVKYAVNPAFLPGLTAAGVVEAHKARAAEKDKKFNSHWDNKTPRW